MIRNNAKIEKVLSALRTQERVLITHDLIFGLDKDEEQLSRKNAKQP